MPRKSRARALAAWVNGVPAGEWRIPTRGDMEFEYDAGWAASPHGRPLSLSLPIAADDLTVKGRAVESYFDNLLPDSDAIRKRVQERFRADSRRPFDLLAAIGGDCIGAVQLLPPGETPTAETTQARALTDADVEAELRHVASPEPLGRDEEPFRISIAGVQEKTALLWHEGRWCRPLGATPTTHIFKLPLGRVGRGQIDMTTSLENEWLCEQILAAYGLPVARSQIETFGSTKVLIVERFDRRLHESGGYWLRLVQEDFCQATATPVSRKYEDEGGPGLREISGILRGSIRRDEDLACLLKAQILFWMLAAIDGHAKNFSIHILPQGRYQLTPLYDVISAWPVIGHGSGKIEHEKAELAMALHGRNKHYKLREIQRRHFNSTARLIRFGDNAEPLILEILGSTPRVISEVHARVPKGFPESVLESVFNGLQEAAKRLESMPAT
jgi:serine/threonine-protein kinase HipA